jgi:DNA-binding FadR family transcriptional regulator
MSAIDGSLLSATTAVYARIARDIGQRIANGQILEGAFLPKEVELQVEFQASRQAVREALKVLGGKGMITARKRAGTSVSPRREWNLLDPDVLSWHAAGSLPDEVLRDLVELRRVIEPLAVTLTVQRADAKAKAKIKDALDEMREGTNDRNLFYKADIAFHMSIYEASDNCLVRQLSTIIAPLLQISFERQKEVHEPLEQGYEAHAAVFRAIEAGDSAAASEAMNHLLDRAITEIYRSKDPTRPHGLP